MIIFYFFILSYSYSRSISIIHSTQQLVSSRIHTSLVLSMHTKKFARTCMYELVVNIYMSLGREGAAASTARTSPSVLPTYQRVGCCATS